MKLIALAVALSLLVGCTAKQPPVAQATSATTAASTPATPEPIDIPMMMDSKAVDRLKKEAKLRHLHFNILCNEDPDEAPFAGEAWPDTGGDTFNPNFIEDGGLASWTARGSTQDAVANRLYVMIRSQEPDFHPKHKRNALNHRQCPEPIHG